MSTNANMQREMCLRGPGGTGGRWGREREESWDQRKPSSQRHKAQPRLWSWWWCHSRGFLQGSRPPDQPSFDPFKVSISSRSDDPIKPRETNIKFRSPQILHFISSRCFVGRAQLLAVQKIFITPQNAKPCAETETAHFDTSPSLQSTFTFTRFQWQLNV